MRTIPGAMRRAFKIWLLFPKEILAIVTGCLVLWSTAYGEAGPAPALRLRVVRQLYIAPDGSDANPGTEQRPLATLEGARDAVRRLKSEGFTNGFNVWVRGGTYYFSSTFALDGRDSGTAEAPVVYRGYPNEKVILTGGLAITNFVPVSSSTVLARLPVEARASVQVADLSKLGIFDYGSLSNRSAFRFTMGSIIGNRMRPWMVQLFFDDQRQQLSRWPNQDKSGEVWAWTTTPSPRLWDIGQNWFTFRENNPKSWALTESVWVHGGWLVWWDDSYEEIVRVSSETNAIITARAGSSGYQADRPYEALNVLEELDQPGEWVINRASNLIYFWPPSTNVNGRTTISALTDDFVTLTNAENVSLQNFTFEKGRGSGVSIRNCTNVVVAGCTMRNLGNAGVIIGNSIYTNHANRLPLTYNYEGGQSNKVVGCHLHDLGQGGIVLSGGNRSTLQPAGNMALNNYIHDFSVNILSGHPAVYISGVGNTVSHAVIHDSAHEAIRFDGNDHLIEYCNIYRVCKDTEDAGFLYDSAGEWTQRGTVLRYNLLQNGPDTFGFYLDDFSSGKTVYGNILLNFGIPVLMGGGRDNTMANNIVFGFGSPGWHVNTRGAGWARGSIPNLISYLKAADVTHTPYSKYAGMTLLNADLLASEANPSDTNLLYELTVAKGNRIFTNIFLSAVPYVYDMDTNRIEQVGNIYLSQFQMFTNFTASSTWKAMDTRNFSLKPNFIAETGFEQIPQSQIGIHADAYGLVNPGMVPTYPPTLARAPFRGHPIPIPGKVQIEDFDEGPEGDAYLRSDHYTAYGNISGTYRREAEFNILRNLTNGVREYLVDMYYAPSWLEYTVNIAKAGAYNLTVAYRTHLKGQFGISIDGTNLATGLTATNLKATVHLPQGKHIMRLTCEVTGGNRLDYINFQKAP